MEAARPSASASRETQELLKLFQEAKKAGAVVQVGPRESPPPSCDPGRGGTCEDESPAALSRAETVVTGALPRRCPLTAEEALRLFQARVQRTGKRSNLAAQLAQDAGVSPRTVRDIWSLRTWTQITSPHWSPADCKRFAARGAGQKPPPQYKKIPKIDRSSEECFDLLPRALDSEWKLHGVWLAAPAEDLDMREFDALLAGRHRESPAFTSARWPDAPAASRFRSPKP